MAVDYSPLMRLQNPGNSFMTGIERGFRIGEAIDASKQRKAQEEMAQQKAEYDKKYYESFSQDMSPEERLATFADRQEETIKILKAREEFKDSRKQARARELYNVLGHSPEATERYLAKTEEAAKSSNDTQLLSEIEEVRTRIKNQTHDGYRANLLNGMKILDPEWAKTLAEEKTEGQRGDALESDAKEKRLTGITERAESKARTEKLKLESAELQQKIDSLDAQAPTPEQQKELNRLKVEKAKLDNQYIKEDINKIKQENKGVLPPEKKTEMALKMGSAWLKEGGQDYIISEKNYQIVKNAPESGPGALSAILAFYKIIDPGSTVTGNEVVTAQNAPGLRAGMITTLNKYIKDGEMDATGFQMFKEAAKNMVDQAKETSEKAKRKYKAMAKANGIEESWVFDVEEVERRNKFQTGSGGTLNQAEAVQFNELFK